MNANASPAADDLRVEAHDVDAVLDLLGHEVHVGQPHGLALPGVVEALDGQSSAQDELHLREVVERPGEGEADKGDPGAERDGAVGPQLVVLTAPVGREVVGAHGRVVDEALLPEQADRVRGQVRGGRAVAVGPVAVEVALHRVDAAQKLLALLRLGHRHGADVTVPVVGELVPVPADLLADLGEGVDRQTRGEEGRPDSLAAQNLEDSRDADACAELAPGGRRGRGHPEHARVEAHRVEVEGQADGAGHGNHSFVVTWRTPMTLRGSHPHDIG